MEKHSKYVTLEIAGERLDSFIRELRDKLLHEFWSSIPDGVEKEKIRSRIEKNIYSALGIMGVKQGVSNRIT